MAIENPLYADLNQSVLDRHTDGFRASPPVIQIVGQTVQLEIKGSTNKSNRMFWIEFRLQIRNRDPHLCDLDRVFRLSN